MQLRRVIPRPGDEVRQDRCAMTRSGGELGKERRDEKQIEEEAGQREAGTRQDGSGGVVGRWHAQGDSH